MLFSNPDKGTENNENLLDLSISFIKEKHVNEEIFRQQKILEQLTISIIIDDINVMREKLLLDKKDFTILETIFPKKKGKLATVYRAMLRGEEVVCKIIQNDRINNFIIEGFLETLCKLR